MHKVFFALTIISMVAAGYFLVSGPRNKPARAPRSDLGQAAERKIPAKGSDTYQLDAHSLEMASRTAAIIAQKGKVSRASIDYYRNVARKAEHACRFRDPLGCWHRGQLADLAGDTQANQWLRKAKIYSGETVRSCRGKQTSKCKRAKTVLTSLNGFHK